MSNANRLVAEAETLVWELSEEQIAAIVAERKAFEDARPVPTRTCCECNEQYSVLDEDENTISLACPGCWSRLVAEIEADNAFVEDD